MNTLEVQRGKNVKTTMTTGLTPEMLNKRKVSKITSKHFDYHLFAVKFQIKYQIPYHEITFTARERERERRAEQNERDVGVDMAIWKCQIQISD